MIEYHLTGDQYIAIFEYSTNMGTTMTSYVFQTFSGELDLKIDAKINDPDFWGTITFENEAYRTWFLMRW